MHVTEFRFDPIIESKGISHKSRYLTLHRSSSIDDRSMQLAPYPYILYTLQYRHIGSAFAIFFAKISVRMLYSTLYTA